MLNRFLFAGVVGIAFAVVFPAAAQEFTLCGTKIQVVVTPPGADADPALAKFSGIWGNGEWSGGLCNAIVVSQVKGKTATVQYFWGTAPGVKGPGTFTQEQATIKSGKYLSFKSIPSGTDVSYELVGGRLKGWFGNTELSKMLQKL